ncbi:hypothetical protein [Megasphaera elsdenii]|uniref:hypothetical protein n=1 Tax=Megasphaera elsdenii TaxID=907 RepID=UPI000512C028|nr:hypothetical protein [Megasphaera elsdenii]KGI89184.1 hypothetical protein JY94_06165 [Megasphaera elsdenii]
MKKFNYIVRMMLVLVVTFMTFSGAALTVQAAEPHSHSHRWEQRDDRDYRHHDGDWEKNRKRWEKDHKSESQKKVDKANRKANIAIGVAAVATIIALAK